jgi:xylulose-5-phosphate/fructose-6-phosphate phosphoketolase
MFNQHAKWLEKSKKELDWRAPVPSINFLITSLVWRQDYNGFTHQDPGFLDVVTNKSPDVVRIYLPPDANCLLSVTDHCLRSRDYVNVIVADKQDHLQYLTMEDAVTHCTKGIGIWNWASGDNGEEPDAVMACAGDIPTMESLAAVAILKERFPDLRIRFVNVVDLFRLTPDTEHPHGLSDRDFDSLFTIDKPVIFNFHSYASLIHKLSYRRKNHDNIHVRGYKEKGKHQHSARTCDSQSDRPLQFGDRRHRSRPRLHSSGAHVKEWLKGQIIASITTLTLKESTKKKFDVGSGPDKLAFSPRCTTSVWFALQGHWELMFAVAPIAYHLLIYYDRWLRQKSDEAVRDARFSG